MAGSLCLSTRISNKLITFFLTLRPSGTVVSGQGAGWAWGDLRSSSGLDGRSNFWSIFSRQ